MSINIPAQDILDIARAIERIQSMASMHPPDVLYVAVTEGRLELLQGTNISYGGRSFASVDPAS